MTHYYELTVNELGGIVSLSVFVGLLIGFILARLERSK